MRCSFNSFKQEPDELLEAAKLDGVNLVRFLIDILIPNSVPTFLALFAILFVIGRNQYLWHLMITTVVKGCFTLGRGIELVDRTGNLGMALAVMAILPPGLLVLVFSAGL